MILGECKYWQEPIGANILRELEKKADSVIWKNNIRRTWFVLFSAAGFSEELKIQAASRNDLLLFDDLESSLN